MIHNDHEMQPDIRFTQFSVIVDISVSLVHPCGQTLCNCVKLAYSSLSILSQKVSEEVQTQYVTLTFFLQQTKPVIFCREIKNSNMKGFCIRDFLYYSHLQVDIRSALANTKTFLRMTVPVTVNTLFCN